MACGTGVVAVTAARIGAQVQGLDLAPALLAEARQSAALAAADIDFVEGDVEALPYANATFDVVLSQFGHIFAPRPEAAIREMLRVLRPGGRIAFSSWPPELLVGRVYDLLARYQPPPAGVAAPSSWGDPAIVQQRLGDAVTGVEFHRDTMTVPTLSPRHYRGVIEVTSASTAKVIGALANDAARLADFRAELDALIGEYWSGNLVHQSYLMTRSIKRACPSSGG